MEKINLAYFGSPGFSADFLEKIITDREISRLAKVKLVVSQPDQPVGRKQVITPTPVRLLAEKYQLKIEKSLKNENCEIKIRNCDLALVYAFGDLIPEELLNLPKFGFWNIHPSLLPKYRGPSPIATPLINGDKITGVTIIRMDEEIDHGPIIAQESYTILNSDYRIDLEKKLTDLSFEMFKQIILKGGDTFFEKIARGPRGGVAVEKNGIEPLIEQNHKTATYTKKLSKQDGFIKFENLKLKIKNSPEQLFNLFRGLSPWPGIWTLLPNGKRLKITGMKLLPSPHSLIPTFVQLEGKNEVDFKTFNQAYKIF